MDSQRDRVAQREADGMPFRARWPLLDRLRGCAVLLMVAYHFCFDLNHYGLLRQDFNHDLRWLALRALIISLFMGAMGASLALAHRVRIDWPALRRRQARLGVACVLVSAGSGLMFPATFIWFGILHFAWCASLLILPLQRLGWGLPVLAFGAILLGNGPGASLFDTPWLGWIGLMTQKPYTEDYVPLLPWFGAVLIGTWLAGLAPAPASRQPRAAPSAAIDQALRLLGRHTLIVYLLHQPLMLAAFELVAWAMARRA